MYRTKSTRRKTQNSRWKIHKTSCAELREADVLLLFIANTLAQLTSLVLAA